MDLLIFCLLIFLSILLSIIEYNTKKNIIIFNFIIILFFMLFVSLRSETFSDTYAYVQYYKLLSPDNIYTSVNDIPVIWTVEIGYFIYGQIIKYIIGESYSIYFFIISLTNLVLIFYSAKTIISAINSYEIIEKRDNNTISIVHPPPTKMKFLYLPIFTLYISYYGFMYNAVVLRAGLALSLLLTAYSQLIVRRYWLGVLFSLLSLFFHSTAICGISAFLFILFHKELSKNKYFLYLIILLFLYIFHIGNYVAPNILRYSYITRYLVLEQGAKIERLLSRAFVFYEYSFSIIILFINMGICIYHKLNNKIYNSLLHSCLLGLTILVLLSPILTVARVTDYFLFYSFILFYLTINNIQDKVIKYTYFSWVVITSSTLFYRAATL